MNTESSGENPLHAYHAKFNELIAEWAHHKNDPGTLSDFENLFHDLEAFERREPLKRLWWMMEALLGGLRKTGHASDTKIENVFAQINRHLEGTAHPGSTHEDMRITHSSLINDILKLMQPAVGKHDPRRKVF